MRVKEVLIIEACPVSFVAVTADGVLQFHFPKVSSSPRIILSHP